MKNKENDNTMEVREHEPIPLYMESPAYAREHGELERYRDSARENSRCARAIAGLIRDTYDGWSLNLPEERIQSLADDYGKDRVAFLVSNSIHCASYDRRYSSRNREWAETRFDFANLSDGYEQFRLTAGNVHPGLLDMFAKKWRELEVKEAEKALDRANPDRKAARDAGTGGKNAGIAHPRR